MSFFCPECSQAALRITASLELPPDSRSDEITLQAVRCSRCGFAAAAVYQESRRGSWDDESVDHRGFYTPPEKLKELRAAIRRCPNQRDPRCTCETHRTYGRVNANGRWMGLEILEVEDSFGMRRG